MSITDVILLFITACFECFAYTTENMVFCKNSAINIMLVPTTA